MDIFNNLAPYIQDYIFDKKWKDFTEIQKKAFTPIYKGCDNVILASSTASGKTEATFFPILNHLYHNPSTSISVLYISPLIALINDQFERLYDLFELGDIDLVKWHGQSSISAKKKILKNKKGVIQITPESLESLLIKEGLNIYKLFFDLRFIVIDEIHCFMSNERGLQIKSLISRIEKIINKKIRIIGLSATLSDYNDASNYLKDCNLLDTTICVSRDREKNVNLSLAAIDYYNNNDDSDGVISTSQPLLNRIYRLVNNKKTINFSNSRKDVEAITAGLKDLIIKENSALEVYSHHGSLSKDQRNEAEEALKTKNNICVGATQTLELGIDIGELDLIVQVGASFSVSSFVQRLGRSGRKEKSKKMIFYIKKYENLFKFNQTYFPIDLLKNIAIIELYINENWIEPKTEFKYCYFLVVHQTISIIKALGALKQSELARTILSQKVFKWITINDLKNILLHLVEIDILEIMEDLTVNLGLLGEKVSNNFEFYAVFLSEKEMAVKFENKIIGSVGKEVKIGDRIVLSSVKWKVISKNEEKMEITVINDGLGGQSKWEGDYFSITDIKIIKKMKEILSSDIKYPFLDDSANKYLEKCRERFNYLKLDRVVIIKICSSTYQLYLWLGSKEMRALSILLEMKGYDNSIENDLILTIDKPNISMIQIISVLREISIAENYNFDDIKISKNVVYNNFKFDNYLPYQYAKKQYIDYSCDFISMQKNLKRILLKKELTYSIY